MLTISPAQAGELKRKTLRCLQRVCDVFVFVGDATWMIGLMAWEACDRAIQRDADKERNERLAKEEPQPASAQVVETSPPEEQPEPDK